MMQHIQVSDEVRGVDAVLRRISSEVRTDAVVPMSSQYAWFDTGTTQQDPEQPSTGIQIHNSGIPELDGSKVIQTEFAHRQIADHSKIPWRYYNMMLDGSGADRQLLQYNVNHWWNTSGDDPRLMRVIHRPSGPSLRAFLSPRYRVLDNEALVANVLQEAESMTDVQVHDASVDSERLYLRLITPITGEIEQGDVCQLGLTIRNSEVGDGAIQISPFILRLVCTNGLVAKSKFRQVHLGYRRDVGIVSPETIAADSQAIFSGIRDWVRYVLDPERLEYTLDLFRCAKEIPMPTEQPRVAIGNVIKAYSLEPREAQSIFERYLRNNDDTQFGVVNAITEAAHSTPNLPMRRQVELEESAGDLLTKGYGGFTGLVSKPLSSKELAKVYGDKS